MAKYSYVVVGLGASGFSAVRWLLQRGESVAATDSRAAPPMLAECREKLTVSAGDIDESLLNQGECIVLSPGVSRADPRIAAQIARGKPVIGDIELFARAVEAPVIAITGTNAKSTVTTLVGEMAAAAGLRAGVGGNLGTPALDLLKQDAALYVLELSSFQLESVDSLCPYVASVLNVTPDHMDRYASFEDYVAVKNQIYQHASIAVYNRDDPATVCKNSTSHQLGFTLGSSGPGLVGLLTHNGEPHLAVGDEPLLPVRALQTSGSHAVANALAALAIGHAFGFPVPSMLETLQQFRGLPHRCQLVRERKGVCWFNDSKGTNVGATLAAINGLGASHPGRLILIAGGVGKGADFSSLLPAIKNYVKKTVLIGESAQELHRLIQPVTETEMAPSMEAAIHITDQSAEAGDIVLLSPACASFDMFSNFEHRGNVFAACVNALV